MVDYKSNSHRSKEAEAKEEVKLDKVVTGSVKIKKKNEIRKFADIFLSEDISNVKSYILMDVLIPSIKKAIDDIVSNGIHMLLYNGDRRGDRRSSVASKISYDGYYRDPRDRREDRPNRARSGFDYEDIIFETRGDAEVVLSAMEDTIERFGSISVGGFYDLAEVSTTNYAINNYGWKDLRSATIVPVRGGGYMIKLPRALPLD